MWYEGRKEFKSKSIIGKIYDMVVEAEKEFLISDIKKPEMDPDLLLPNKDRFLVEAKRYLEAYNKRVRKIMEDTEKADSEDDGATKNLRNAQLTTISKDFRAEFERGLNREYPIDELDKASAWYYVSFDHASKNWDKNPEGRKPGFAFAWSIVDDILNRIKADKCSREQNGRLAPSQGLFFSKK